MLIQDQHRLDDVCEKLLVSDVIAFDTEFMRRSTYYPTLCLIQLSDGKEVFVIDACAGLRLDGLAEVFNSPHKLKIVHSGAQDVEALRRAMNVMPQNLFDTQIAAQFLGYEVPPSYGLLVQEHCNVTLSKECQYSEWSARPLGADQLEYAGLDVKYLHQLYGIMRAKLAQKGQLEWFEEESAQVAKSFLLEKSLENIFLKLSATVNKKRGCRRLYWLILKREYAAKCKNLPRVRVLHDKQVIRTALNGKINNVIAQRLCVAQEDLDRASEDESIDAIIDELLMTKMKPTREAAIYYDLCELLDSKAAEYGIAPALIVTRVELKRLVYQMFNGCRVLSGWRYTVFGKAAEELMKDAIPV